MKRYEVGERVVHKTHGLGEVVAIEERELVTGKKSSYYILGIVDCGTTKKVFVDVKTAGERLRPCITRAEAEQICAHLAFAKPSGVFEHQTWNRRYRTYMEQIHTGDAMEIANVLVSLRALREEKSLSFGERKLMEQASALLRAELSAVGVSLPEVSS